MYILDDLYLISSEILTNFQGLAEYINIKLYLSIMKVASPKKLKETTIERATIRSRILMNPKNFFRVHLHGLLLHLLNLYCLDD